MADDPDLVADGEDWLVTAALTPTLAGNPIEPLYRGAAGGELVLPFCAACGLPVELDQQVCDGCDGGDGGGPDGGEAIAWRAVAPTGVVHAATTVHRREPGLIRTTEPYQVVDVEVSSGHRLVTTTVAATAEAAAIGQPVSISFRTVGGVALPAVRLLDDQRHEHDRQDQHRQPGKHGQPGKHSQHSQPGQPHVSETEVSP